MNKSILYILGIISVFLVSCTQNFDELSNSVSDKGVLNIELANYMIDGMSNSLSGENDINDIKACLFNEGTLDSVYDLVETETGDYNLKIDKKEGTLYVVANGASYGVLDNIKPSVTKETDWITFVANVNNNPEMFFTGKLDLHDISINTNSAKLTLKRGLSRFDIQGLSEQLKLKAITVSGISNKVYFFPQDVVSLPEEAEVVSNTISFTNYLIQDKSGVLYLHEQPNNSLEIKLLLDVNGTEKEVTTNLPDVKELKRNAVYTLQLSASGNIIIGIKVDEWGADDSTIGYPNYKAPIKVNIENSVLPGVEIIEEGNVLIFPHQASENVLSLSCSNELELMPYQDGVISVEPMKGGSGNILKNTYKIQKKLLPPGVSSAPIKLSFKRKGLNNVYDNDNITVQFKSNPNKIYGSLEFDPVTAICDFETYVENEIGIFEVEDGKEVVIEVDDDEWPWLLSEKDVNNPRKFRILAGWRPNDPKADGRTQEAKIVIKDINSPDFISEVYTVRRKNYGLPVVKINGKWWCKYNLRKNCKVFEDQVSISEDISWNGDVFEYLKNCSESEIYDIMGYQYQGGNNQALPLAHDGDKYYFDGYKSNASSIGDMPATEMAPLGYELPTYADLRFFAVEGNPNDSNIGSNNRVYNNGLGQTISLEFSKREVNLLNKKYGYISLFDYSVKGDDGNHFVMYGLGHQWDANHGSITFDPLQFIFGVAESPGLAWTMECWYTKEIANRGSWYKYVNHNNSKTRILRCIKSPVEYIYEE